MNEELALRAKLIPPRPRRYFLNRPALSARLLEARRYRLTVVQASTGYGKSTALVAALRDADLDLFWYSISETDQDPLLFLLHIIYAFRSVWPDLGEEALNIVEEAGLIPQAYRAIVDTLSNELVLRMSGGETREAILVLDDYHLVNPSSQVNAIVDYFLELLPPALHLVIATQHRPALESLVRWQVKGELLAVGQRDLAFSGDEIETLFRTQYGLVLSPEQVRRLATETEGWVMALQMIWQSAQSQMPNSLDQILEELPRSMEGLFAYLAQEVLAHRPDHIQDFLLRTSVLRQLDPAACDHLLGWEGSESVLKRLDEDSFFLVHLGEAYRYHHLFHDFLRQQAARDPVRVQLLHRRAADFYQGQGKLEEAIHHWLAAGEHEAAARVMDQVSRSLVQGGRFDTLSEWVTALPPAVLEQFPNLILQMGELCRFGSRFDEALAWYQRAGERFRAQRDVAGASRALRGQAAVYLDTVRPLKAESLLQEALSLVDGQPDREEQAQLLDLMAENMTNRGKWEEAASLRRRARELREEGPGAGDRDVRVLLRTGRLREASAVLEERAAEERITSQKDRFREPRAHRESLLLLSLIYAWRGYPQKSLTCAQEGIALGQRLHSPFIEAVGYMRLGHAWQMVHRPDSMERALECYARAMDLGEQLAVARTRVEALWGLCRLYGYSGDLEAAERNAFEGIEVGLKAGDEWIAALIGVTLGAAYVIAGHPESASHWLDRSIIAFRDLGDSFGQVLARLWQSVLYSQDDSSQLLPALDDLLALLRAHGHRFLFFRPNFLGPMDPPALAPLLITAQQNRDRLAHAAVAAQLLRELRLPPDLDFHPAYTLRILTLGQFAVHRGQEPIAEGDWHREKARHLLQLFLVNRDRFLHRDEIIEHLWPETGPSAAEQQFKVTLNALQGVLEPERPPRAPTLFVQRRSSTYGLNPDAPILVDAVLFEELLGQGNASQDATAALNYYRQALILYRGNFLPNCLYQDYCREEQERLKRLYLNANTRTAEMLLALETPQAISELIVLCEGALLIDNCWEPAYQMLMRAFMQREDRVQALRVYERCVNCLQREMEVQPMPETVALYQAIRN